MAALLAANRPLGLRAKTPLFSTPKSRARAGVVAPKAALDSGVTLAVTQQAVMFAACVAGETYYTRSITAEGAAGRPEIIPTLPCAGGVLAAVLLCQSGFTALPGVAIGGATSSYLLYLYAMRFVATEDDPREWPGPKAWPAAMALISFFAVNIFLQALTN